MSKEYSHRYFISGFFNIGNGSRQHYCWGTISTNDSSVTTMKKYISEQATSLGFEFDQFVCVAFNELPN